MICHECTDPSEKNDFCARPAEVTACQNNTVCGRRNRVVNGRQGKMVLV